MNLLAKTQLKEVKHIIVVASGKGGVGKSTVAANIAITLAKKGYKTALLDADIYGPSIPKLFGIENEMIKVLSPDEEEKMVPIEKWGVKINSIGFLVDNSKAVIWRGPLAANALSQLFTKTVWGETDYLIVDFPPGTGDIQISTIQQFEVSGAIVVTTPQIISVNDARKGAEMFSPDKMNIPLVGIVENMSWFTPKEHPQEKYYLFGQGGGQLLADEFSCKLLAQIPLIKEVGVSAENGENLIDLNNSEVNNAFDNILKAIENIH